MISPFMYLYLLFFVIQETLCCDQSDPVNHQHPDEICEEKTGYDSNIWFSVLNGDTAFFNKIDRRYQTWILSILASCVIGLSGIVPLLFIPVEMGLKLSQTQGSGKYLRLLLSFAVGGLLGDVFLHLLPEAWNSTYQNGPSVHSKHLNLGLWVLVGMFSFIVLEIMFTASQAKKQIPENTTIASEPLFYDNKNSNSDKLAMEYNTHQIDKKNGFSNGCLKAEYELPTAPENIHVTGYLNLMANSIDNFTHGLAVAASFLVGCKMGILTTFAILIHEIPHEIGDFAILLKSGFHPRSAAKAQISTATIGILGAIVALCTESDRIGVCTSWILPFTSGGFLNIALVNVLPDLLKEKDPWESIKQFGCLCAGIGIMALVSFFVH